MATIVGYKQINKQNGESNAFCLTVEADYSSASGGSATVTGYLKMYHAGAYVPYYQWAHTVNFSINGTSKYSGALNEPNTSGDWTSTSTSINGKTYQRVCTIGSWSQSVSYGYGSAYSCPLSGSYSVTGSANYLPATGTHSASGSISLPSQTATKPTSCSVTSVSVGTTTATVTASVGGTYTSVQYSKDGSNWQSSSSFTGLHPHTTYNFYARAANSNSGWVTSSAYAKTTDTPSLPTYTVSFDSITRTSARMVIDITADPDNYWKVHYYNTSDQWLGATSKATGTYYYTYSGLTPNTNYTVYTRVGASTASGADQDVQSRVARTFKTSGNAPSITSHGVQSYGQASMTMQYSATYDTNDSLSSYKWEYGTTTSYGSSVSNTNTINWLEPNTTYYYKLTVTSAQGRTASATGSFKTDYKTQQITSITTEDITETSISGSVSVPNPSWLTNLTIWIYSGDTLINTITKTSGITSSNSFLFEDLSPGTPYDIKARITTLTQNATGGYTSNIATLGVVTVDSSPVHIIDSNGLDKKYKMYVMGKGNIYNADMLSWQNGYYATGTIGQSVFDLLTQSTEINGGAAAALTHIEILPNTPYTITNNEEDVDFVIHGTDANNNVTVTGYTISPGNTYTYTGTTSTTRLYVSIKSSSNPVVNYATAKFFKLNIFRTVEKTLIPKDNIVYINGKIRYIDIIQAGNTINNGSHIVALKVYDSSGNDIALNKTVTMIKGKGPLNLSRITDGDITSSDYATIEGKTSNDLETIVRVDLGQDYTNIDHITLWRYYADDRTYYNTKLQGRDSTTRLTWKFQDYRMQGEYVETSSGYSASIRHEEILGVPMILSILQEPNNSTNTITGTKITINADWVASIPPVLDSWISYRTDAILAANRGRLLKEEIGSLSELTTTAKSSLVEAINEVWNDYNGSDSYTNILNAVLNAILNK